MLPLSFSHSSEMAKEILSFSFDASVFLCAGQIESPTLIVCNLKVSLYRTHYYAIAQCNLEEFW